MDLTDVNAVQAEMKRKIAQSLRFASEEFASLRTGRASGGMLENIGVDYYGNTTPLAQLGNITVPEPQLLVVQVYDAAVVKAVEKAIVNSNLGLSPNTEGTVLRIVVPVLTAERRKLLVRQLRKMGEEHKVVLRNLRREANDKAKHLEKEKIISQDALHAAESDIQTEIDDAIQRADQMMKNKEKELMQV